MPTLGRLRFKESKKLRFVPQFAVANNNETVVYDKETNNSLLEQSNIVDDTIVVSMDVTAS